MKKVRLFTLFCLLISSSVLAQQKPTCAVLTFDAGEGITKGQAKLLSDRFSIELGRLGKYTIVSRSKMSEILKLQTESQSDACSTTECAIEAGQLLGVQYMIYGSIGKIGSLYTINTYLVNVESGAVEKSTTTDIKGTIEDLLTRAINHNARRLLGEGVGTGSVLMGGGSLTTGVSGDSYLPVDIKLPKDLRTVSEAKLAPLDGLAHGSKEAQELQKQVMTQFKLPLEVESVKTKIRFRLVPSGTFMMGDSGFQKLAQPDERPPHKVTITRPFYLSKLEITHEQLENVIGKPSRRVRKAASDHPVIYINWNDCHQFCLRLCKAENVSQGSYRLPTEGEWEYACRAGTESTYYTGETEQDLARAAWYMKNSRGRAQPVRQKQSNGWGLYDMHGNVFEWCLDWYGNYSHSAQKDPQGAPGGAFRVARGGCWKLAPSYSRSSRRYYQVPTDDRSSLTGFRIVRELVPAQASGY